MNLSIFLIDHPLAAVRSASPFGLPGLPPLPRAGK
jgi:hypothetical protein